MQVTARKMQTFITEKRRSFNFFHKANKIQMQNAHYITKK